MSYFSSLYPNIKYPKSKPNQPVGLRNAQIGAIHAIGQHFTLYENEPALIVMPTGSGKTAVLSLSPYLLEANRVLVVSSSRLVRGQIYNELKELKTLRKIGVFAKDVRLPKCKEVVSGLNSIEEWNDLKNYDFSIGLPNSLTTGLNDGINPPTDIFDLILVDESHHIPASTWTLITD
ncbi:MAG: DEAD/DEAH box helicase family protein, partial [Bacteroidota bacterium]